MGGRGDAGNDIVELEAMRQDTFSWHPCQVSLRSNGLGLIVQYKDGNFEEILTDGEGVIARIRVRSSPLEGDDCASIQQGDHVLATRNSHVEGIFYDARIDEAIRVRHSKRSYCRCSFTIKWPDKAFNGEVLTLPASSIMKLSRSNIKHHPTISAFFSMVETSSGEDALPFSTTDDMDCEVDLNVMLERQIREITHSNDVPSKVTGKFVIGLEDATGQGHGKATAAFFKNLCTMNPLVTNLKGSTGSKNSVTMMGNCPAPIPTTEEEATGIRSPLNPLAAWAALASSRTKFPHGVEHSSLSNEYPLNMSVTLEGKNSTYEGIVKTLFLDPDASQSDELLNEPIRAHGKGNKESRKKVIPSPQTRVTRAQTQRNSRMQEVAPMSETNVKQSMASSKTRRVTRSTANGAENIELEESKNVTEENMSTRLTKLECGAHHLTTSNKMSVASSVHSDTNASDEIAKSLSGKDGSAINGASSQGTIIEDARKLNSSRRVTRSAAQECAEKNNFQPEPELRKRKLCESSELKLEDNVISNSTCSELKRSISSTRADKNSARGAKEGENSTPNTSEPAANHRKDRKRPTNSRMQATRSSPRLNLTRTR